MRPVSYLPAWNKRRAVARNLVGFLDNLYSKQKERIAAQAVEQLEPGESLQRLLLARLKENRTGRQVAVLATERNLYGADVGTISKLKPADMKFPLQSARATYAGGRLVLSDLSDVVRRGEGEAEELFEHWVLYPEKTAGRDPDEFAAFVNERSTEPEANAGS